MRRKNSRNYNDGRMDYDGYGQRTIGSFIVTVTKNFALEPLKHNILLPDILRHESGPGPNMDCFKFCLLFWKTPSFSLDLCRSSLDLPWSSTSLKVGPTLFQLGLMQVQLGPTWVQPRYYIDYMYSLRDSVCNKRNTVFWVA